MSFLIIIIKSTSVNGMCTFGRAFLFIRKIFSERSAQKKFYIFGDYTSRFDRLSSVCPLATVAWLEILTLNCVTHFAPYKICTSTQWEKGHRSPCHLSDTSRGLSLSPNVNEISKDTLWEWSIVYLICTDRIYHIALNKLG